LISRLNADEILLMNTPKLPAADGYGRRQVLVILSGLLLATFVASLDQTVATAAMYRIGESGPACPARRRMAW